MKEVSNDSVGSAESSVVTLEYSSLFKSCSYSNNSSIVWTNFHEKFVGTFLTNVLKLVPVLEKRGDINPSFVKDFKEVA